MSNSEFQSYTVERTGERNLRFTGRLWASESTSSATNDIRWKEYSIYVTKAGKYVCARASITRWQGESDSFDAVVVDSEEKIVEYFGTSESAKRLYEEAGIDTDEVIE